MIGVGVSRSAAMANAVAWVADPCARTVDGGGRFPVHIAPEWREALRKGGVVVALGSGDDLGRCAMACTCELVEWVRDRSFPIRVDLAKVDERGRIGVPGRNGMASGVSGVLGRQTGGLCD